MNETCVKCGGSGGGDDPVLRCPSCNGTGRVAIPPLAKPFAAWFKGESQLDYHEWGFDGSIWEAPSQEDLAREKAGGPPVEPYLVAELIRDERYADLIVRAVNSYADLLEACELAISEDGRQGDGRMWPATVKAIREAIKKAKGETR